MPPLTFVITKVDVLGVTIINAPPIPEKGILDYKMSVQIAGMYHFVSPSNETMFKKFTIDVEISKLDIAHQALINTLYSWAEGLIKGHVGIK